MSINQHTSRCPTPSIPLHRVPLFQATRRIDMSSLSSEHLHDRIAPSYGLHLCIDRLFVSRLSSHVLASCLRPGLQLVRTPLQQVRPYHWDGPRYIMASRQE